jgi:hypothetical protein
MAGSNPHSKRFIVGNFGLPTSSPRAGALLSGLGGGAPGARMIPPPPSSLLPVIPRVNGTAALPAGAAVATIDESGTQPSPPSSASALLTALAAAEKQRARADDSVAAGSKRKRDDDDTPTAAAPPASVVLAATAPHHIDKRLKSEHPTQQDVAASPPVKMEDDAAVAAVTSPEAAVHGVGARPSSPHTASLLCDETELASAAHLDQVVKDELLANTAAAAAAAAKQAALSTVDPSAPSVVLTSDQQLERLQERALLNDVAHLMSVFKARVVSDMKHKQQHADNTTEAQAATAMATDSTQNEAPTDEAATSSNVPAAFGAGSTAAPVMLTTAGMQ